MSDAEILKLKCSHCKETKPCKDFYKSKVKRGFQSWCKLCQHNRNRYEDIIYFNCIICNNLCKRTKLYQKVENKRVKLCCRCKLKERLKLNGGHSWNYNGSENFTGNLISSWRNSAKRRGYSWELSKEELEEKFKEQKGICALSGLNMGGNFGSGRRPSLDRIDPKLGYSKNNIQFVCTAINIMRNRLTEDEFIFWCQSVANFKSNKKDDKCIISNFNSKPQTEKSTIISNNVNHLLSDSEKPQKDSSIKSTIEDIKNKINNMTPEEFKQSIINSGIINLNGKLTEKYKKRA